jgi:N-acyl-phosphatidylethanolamine-hydrolysing phospholipase D
VNRSTNVARRRDRQATALARIAACALAGILCATVLSAGACRAAQPADPPATPAVSPTPSPTASPPPAPADPQSSLYDDPALHRTADGFHNPDETPEEQGRRGRVALLRWQWERLWSDLPKKVPGGWRPPVTKPNLAPYRTPGPDPVFTWLGHDTFLLTIGGVVIATDPHLSERASPVTFAGPKRLVPPPVQVGELPHVDLVLVSHNHYDHMDRATLQGLQAQAGGPPLFIVPLGNLHWMTEQGIANVRELDWWEHVEFRGLTVHAVPAQHFSARTPFDTNRTLWSGFIVEHPTFRFYFAGDTGYGPLFKEIGRRFAPIDLAAIPIGAYEPRWFMQPVHADPAEAVKIHEDVGARRSVGMHWGTFQLTDEAMDEPPQALGAALTAAGIPRDAFFVMGFGETRHMAQRPEGKAAQLKEVPIAALPNARSSAR